MPKINEEDIKNYELQVKTLARLINSGLAFIRIESTSEVKLLLEKDMLLEETEFDDPIIGEIKEYFEDEISEVIMIILSDQEKFYTVPPKRMLEDAEDEEEKKGMLERAEERKRKVSIVKEHLITEILKAEFLFKTTAKGNLFKNINWSTASLIEDKDLGKERDHNIVYATIQLELFNPKEEALSIFRWLGVNIPIPHHFKEFEKNYITFQCDVSDLREIIKDLNRVIKILVEKRGYHDHGP